MLFLSVFAIHVGLLRLPYFWDEVGYYVPAARDILLHRSMVPLSTPSNAHPPLVMAYLALWWKVAGYSVIITRIAMLWVAVFALLGLYRLVRSVAAFEVALASTALTAVYPVFFVQSSLAHVDLAAAALTFWALLAYVEDRRAAMVAWLSLAAVAKETAVLATLALFAWELLRYALRTRWRFSSQRLAGPCLARTASLLLPLVPLALWYVYHYSRSGYVFGNPEYVRYNVQATIHPLRVLLTFLMRLWQTVGYMHLWMLTIAAGLAMWLPAQRDGTAQRSRIAWDVQFAFLSVVAVYVLAMSVIGGAVLARYMLTCVPLVITVCVSTLWRRVRLWQPVTAIVAFGAVVALFVNPPYGFSFEDNLAYRDFIVLHQHAETFLQVHYPTARVLTAWPANDELTRPHLGYVTRPIRVVRIEDFSAEELMSAAEFRSNFDVALVFSTKYEPPRPLLNWPAWDALKIRFFGYHHDLPPPLAARVLGGDLVFSETRNGQWAAVIELEQVHEAKMMSDLLRH